MNELAVNYSTLSITELEKLSVSLNEQYEEFQSEKLKLDLTRGKPAAEQLDLSNSLDGILDGFYLLQDGTDVRNYGGLLGIPEARSLGGELLGLAASEIMVGGNSSLSLMYQYVAHMMKTFWQQESLEQGSKVKFLCPVPGYDRHFAICEHFDIEMLNVAMDESGPDMAELKRLVESDPMIKGIWCVPKYSNPGGQTYSATKVKAMAALPAFAGDNFRIMWDNAYVVHHLSDNPDILLNLRDEARKVSSYDNVVMLASSSKITFAGAGIAFIGLSEKNLQLFESFLCASMIGADKVNQLRHVRFLVDAEGIQAHMEKHKTIIKPKFELVTQLLRERLGGKGIATWTQPNGGYFISLDTLPGLARKTVAMAGAIGVKLTPAGATFPYGIDPQDKNIRIAPTYPSLSELKQALDVLVLCLQLATVNCLIESA